MLDWVHFMPHEPDGPSGVWARKGHVSCFLCWTASIPKSLSRNSVWDSSQSPDRKCTLCRWQVHCATSRKRRNLHQPAQTVNPFSRSMVSWWANFARDHQPDPSWTPATEDDELKYWVIGDKGVVGEMQERKELERLEQWFKASPTFF